MLWTLLLFFFIPATLTLHLSFLFATMTFQTMHYLIPPTPQLVVTQQSADRDGALSPLHVQHHEPRHRQVAEEGLQEHVRSVRRGRGQDAVVRKVQGKSRAIYAIKTTSLSRADA
jgi:hypothetical protein